MALSEFRWNKKRKHYSYLFKKKGDYRKNLLLTTDPVVKGKKHGKKTEMKNVELYKHPNPNSTKKVYVIPKVYTDHHNSFDERTYQWNFDKNDKRKIKKIKSGKYKGKFDYLE